MTCRHQPNDPACSNHPNNRAYAEARTSLSLRDTVPATPDASAFSIEDVYETSGNLVLRVKYPNCSKCSYEGLKVMVFLGKTVKDALFWKKIDPHFRDGSKIAPSKHEAPGPDARFPASPAGWDHACEYANRMVKKK